MDALNFRNGLYILGAQTKGGLNRNVIELLRIEESIGRISAEFAYLYPPGIPLITPGEQITGQFIRNMRIYMDKGLYLQGLEDYTNKTILVVEQQPQSTKEQDEEIHG